MSKHSNRNASVTAAATNKDDDDDDNDDGKEDDEEEDDVCELVVAMFVAVPSAAVSTKEATEAAKSCDT